jgi:uncharacterized membrane protein
MPTASPPAPPPPPPAPPAWRPPPPLPRVNWLEPAVRPGPMALVAVVAGGVTADLAVRSGWAGAGGALLVFALAAGLIAFGLGPYRDGTRVSWQALALAGCAPLFGVWLALRTSPWLLPLDTLAAFGLLGLAAMLARSGSLADLGVSRLTVKAAQAVAATVTAPALVVTALGGGRQESPGRQARRKVTLAVLSGLLLSVPVIVVFGALLASADPVFASFFDPATMLGHATLLAIGAWIAGGLLRTATVKPAPVGPPSFHWLGPAEVLVVLAAIDLLFGAFAAAQLVALGDGGRRVLETAGLTWAEYARSGFFQLLAVASMTVVVLLCLRGWTRSGGPGGRWVSILGIITLALTMVMVVVAFRRLGLYIDEFGLTMLRLFSLLFTVWIGVVLVLFALVLIPRAGRGRAWFGPAALGTGLVLLLAINVADPETLVVEHNRDAAVRIERYDDGYTYQLSDDAVPTVLGTLDKLTPAERAEALESVAWCQGAVSTHQPSHRGWAAWNWSRARAQTARDEACRRWAGQG